MSQQPDRLVEVEGSRVGGDLLDAQQQAFERQQNTARIGLGGRAAVLIGSPELVVARKLAQ